MTFAGIVNSTDPMNVTKANMTLRITSLTQDKLNGRTFVFKAVNAQGVTAHQVKLEAQMRGTAAKAMTALSPASIMLLVILNVFFSRTSN
jgi:hypothetical protein